MKRGKGALVLFAVPMVVLVLTLAGPLDQRTSCVLAVAQSTTMSVDGGGGGGGESLGEAPDMDDDVTLPSGGPTAATTRTPASDDDDLGEAPDMGREVLASSTPSAAAPSWRSSSPPSTSDGTTATTAATSTAASTATPPLPASQQQQATSASTTPAAVDHCATTSLGMRLDPINLIQRAPNASQEEHCCRACQPFQLCKGWSFNAETQECELFSQTTEGPIPEGTNAFDWSSGTIQRETAPDYHCADDPNCADCRASLGTCTRCNNHYYLLAGECVPSCTPHGYINFGERQRGRECVAPFTCAMPECECPSSQFGKHCHQCEVGYGDTSRCVQCRDDRYLVHGRCRLEIVCRGYNYEEFPELSCNCRTGELQGNCFRCTHRGGFSAGLPEVGCRRCRNALYFNSDTGACVTAQECPAGTVPTNSGNFGRECLPPSLCSRRRHKETGRTCRCFDVTNCHTCYFGEDGHECRLCRNAKYLHDGQCVAACPSTTAHANTRGRYNRKCTPSFTCTAGVSSLDGSKCVCPDRECTSCRYEVGNVPGEATCFDCTQGHTLSQTGACIPL